MKGDIRCIEGRLFRHDPQHDDPELETDVGQCEECFGDGCEQDTDWQNRARALEAENARLRAWANKRLQGYRAQWLRAAKAALDGDMRDIRLRVQLEEASPVAIVTSSLAQQPSAEAASAEAMADWSDLPRNMFVTSARKIDPIFWEATVCQVPMAIGPEVMYVRSDMIAAYIASVRQEAEAAMKERCAKVARDGCLVSPDGCCPAEDERLICEAIAAAIQALAS
jgi:hypothetical protein